MSRSGLFVRIAAALADEPLADAIAGDLLEQRRRRPGVRGALWFWQVSAGLLVYLLIQRGRTVVWQALSSGIGSSLRRGELRQAMRSLRRTPWYSVTVVAVIALSIALAATVFGIVDGVLFKPLPYPDADRLVAIRGGFKDPSVRGNRSAKPVELDAWQRAMPDVQFAGFADSRGDTGLEAPNDPELGMALIRPGFFETIGVHPMIGGFTESDYAHAGGPIPIVLTHALWQRRFGGDRAILGLEIPSDPRIGRFRVVGVMPPGFVIPHEENAAMLLPHFGRPTQNSLNVVARLPEGMSLDAFQARIDAVFQAMTESESRPPGLNRFLWHPDRAIVVPLGDRMAGPVAALFRALFAGVVILSLIACLNVSGLMAARTLDRGRELAICRAIGARAVDLARTIVVEHALLFAAGAAIGLAAAGPLLSVTLSMLPDRVHLMKAPGLDARAIVFAGAGAVVMLAIASIWPLARAVTAGTGPIATTGGRLSTARARSASRSGIVSAQVAAALLLVVGGGLIVGSLLRVWQNPAGFELRQLVVAEISAPVATAGVAGEAEVAARVDAFVARVRDLPGVVAAGVADGRVLDRSIQYGVGVFTYPDGTRLRDAGFLGVPVSAGFFAAAGLQVRAGRMPSDSELQTGIRVAAVAQNLADALWPDRPAVGQQLRGRDGLYTIVGVVDDAPYVAWDERSPGALYVPYTTFHFSSAPSVFVRTARPSGDTLRDLLTLGETTAPTLRIVRAMPAAGMLADTVRERRLRSWLFGSFAAAGLALVAVGILGLVAMSTARRTREVGIRMALGATAATVVRGLVREQLRPIVAGVVLGAALAAWAVGFLRAYLYELTMYEPGVWIAAIVMVAATAFAGASIPAARASRVDPVRALRVE